LRGRNLQIRWHMKPSFGLLTVAAWALALHPAPASPQTAADVLVEGPGAKLTRADWEAELTRVPADQRTSFATNPQRVNSALNNLLVNRTLAERARARGIDNDPVVQRRLALETDRALAALMIERIEAEAGAEFDRAAERNLARARELYLVNRAKYVTPEEIEVSHILFDVSKRGDAAALAAAKEARAKLLAGEDFAALAAAVSDDPTATRNRGRLASSSRGRFDPVFEAAAFALKNRGDLSEPVLSRYGYHLIRLEGRTPARQPTFDEARPVILAEMRQKFVSDAREAAVVAIRTDRSLQVNQGAIDALVVKVEAPSPGNAPREAGAPGGAPGAK
jgi:peptidyl-prolyl cis-trans isomerase C